MDSVWKDCDLHDREEIHWEREREWEGREGGAWGLCAVAFISSCCFEEALAVMKMLNPCTAKLSCSLSHFQSHTLTSFFLTASAFFFSSFFSLCLSIRHAQGTCSSFLSSDRCTPSPWYSLSLSLSSRLTLPQHNPALSGELVEPKALEAIGCLLPSLPALPCPACLHALLVSLNFSLALQILLSPADPLKRIPESLSDFVTRVCVERRQGTEPGQDREGERTEWWENSIKLKSNKVGLCRVTHVKSYDICHPLSPALICTTQQGAVFGMPYQVIKQLLSLSTCT